MKINNWRNILKWTPRIVLIVFALFVGMFAFEEPVFSIGFFMQLIPSLVLILLLVLAWKKPLIGGSLFLVLGVVFTIFFDLYEELIGFLIIGLPIFLIGILFVLDWNLREKAKKKSHSKKL